MALKIDTYEHFLRCLETDAVNHIAYYHYTRWCCLKKMLTEASCAGGERHKLLLLTRADKTNDRIETKWPKNYYLACFSLSRYEDVAMWLNYGKREPDAVRIRITRDAMDKWLEAKPHKTFTVSGDPDYFEFVDDISDCVKSVKLYGMAYVIPSHHWIDESDKILASPSTSEYVVQNGNIEIGRSFFRIKKDGTFKWVDKIYKGKSLAKSGIPPVFKKRGWAYEREIRLVVEMNPGKNFGDRIALAFDGPFDGLLKYMKMSKRARQSKDQLLGERMTRDTKVWDARFPMIQTGPWYDEKIGNDSIGAFKLKDAFVSEYCHEINMIFPKEKGNG